MKPQIAIHSEPKLKRKIFNYVKLNPRMAKSHVLQLILTLDVALLRFTGTSRRSCAKSITSSSLISCQHMEYDKTTTTSFSELLLFLAISRNSN